jgi:membrane-associated phospholipid phosphatase
MNRTHDHAPSADDLSGNPDRRRVVGAAIAGMLIAAALFAALALSIHTGNALTRVDEALVTALRGAVADDTLRAFGRITLLGDTVLRIALCVLGAAGLFAQRQRLLAAALLGSTLGNSLLNHGLKSLFERVRPLHDHSHAFETGWSFPSGHASGAVVTYGMAAYVLLRVLPARWRMPVLQAAAFAVLAAAASRIVLQVHYPSDVLAGMASGAAWLSLCIVTVELLQRRSAPPCNHPGRAMPERGTNHQGEAS